MGTSFAVNFLCYRYKDHPHAYGDKLSHSRYTSPPLGSSPRVWGQGTTARATAKATRIIPTRMGTRQAERPIRADNRDHPHAYGDKKRLIGRDYRIAGSSPRVWGQDYIVNNLTPNMRIIRTRMGTRSSVF